MSNVLPLEAKNVARRRLRLRFILVTALVLLCAAGIASIAILPAFISVRIAEQALRIEVDEASKAVQTDQAEQARAFALIAALTPYAAATTSPTQMVTSALTLKPAGLRITSARYDKGKIILSGVTRDREALNAYREDLEKSALFKSVVIPVAALVGTQDGRFTITLSGAF